MHELLSVDQETQKPHSILYYNTIKENLRYILPNGREVFKSSYTIWFFCTILNVTILIVTHSFKTSAENISKHCLSKIGT